MLRINLYLQMNLAIVLFSTIAQTHKHMHEWGRLAVGAGTGAGAGNGRGAGADDGRGAAAGDGDGFSIVLRTMSNHRKKRSWQLIKRVDVNSIEESN